MKMTGVLQDQSFQIGWLHTIEELYMGRLREGLE